VIALLMPHAGHHAASHAAPLAILPQLFRRAIAAVRRKPAVPAGVAAGAATALLTPPDGTPVLGDRMLSDVRRERNEDAEIAALSGPEIRAPGVRKILPRADGQIVIGDDNRVHVRPVNGRLLGTLPRRTPAATLNRAPWETGSFTVPGDVTLVPAYGQAPVARVLEGERLADVMLP
jgi:hypothetical protein